MYRVRAACLEWVIVVLAGVLAAIYHLIGIAEKLYAHRKIILKLGEVLRKVAFPVSIASLIVATFYLRSQVNPTTLVNFPPFSQSPFPHLSLYAAALLDNLTYSWVGALAFSIVYINRNHLGRFSWAGKLSRRTMKVFLWSYPAMVLWFSVAAEISFLIPSWAQTPLWLTAAYPLSMIVFRSAETVIGRRVFGKQGIVSAAIDKALGIASVGMRSIGAGIYGGVFSRLGAPHFEEIPRSSIRASIAALITFLSLVSIGVAYELGYTSILQLSYAFGVAPYALAIVSGVVGWRILKREAEEVALSRLTKSLDLFQRGAYPRTFSIHTVVHLVNTRVGHEINEPFEPWGFEKTLATLVLLEQQGYHIQVDTEKERVTFTLYPL